MKQLCEEKWPIRSWKLSNFFEIYPNDLITISIIASVCTCVYHVIRWPLLYWLITSCARVVRVTVFCFLNNIISARFSGFLQLHCLFISKNRNASQNGMMDRIASSQKHDKLR